MRSLVLKFAAGLLATLACFARISPATAHPLSGRVVGVIDGDTIDILIETNRTARIRLAEIDAPEHDQPWGAKSKRALSDLVFGKAVTLRVATHDRYGRTVARLWVGDVDVNREMIRQGAAWAFVQYLTDHSLLQVEASARRNHLGLWSLPEPQRRPPWEWRHSGSRQLSLLPNSAPLGLAKATSAFTCGVKQYCREMGSCAEATWYLHVCGLRRLDGDGDGVPCELLCRK